MAYPQYEITLIGLDAGDDQRQILGSHTGGMRILATNATLTVEHHADDDEFPQVIIRLKSPGV